jgi:hypothetical protein
VALRDGSRWPNKPPLGYPLDLAHPLAQGLVFDALLNENAGGPWDPVGRVKGTLSGPPTWTQGDVGPALNFGGSQYVDFGTISALNLTSNFTVAVRVWHSGWGTQGSAGIFTHQDSSNGWGVVVDNSVPSFICFNGGAFTYLDWSGSISDKSWHTFVARKASGSSGTRNTFLNGVKGTTSDTQAAGSNATINAVMGRFYGNQNNFYLNGGRVGWAKVWNVALPDALIARLQDDPYAMYLPPNQRRWFAASLLPPARRVNWPLVCAPQPPASSFE